MARQMIFDEAGNLAHRRALFAMASVRQRALPQTHRDQPAARRICHGARYREDGHQQRNPGRPVRARPAGRQPLQVVGQPAMPPRPPRSSRPVKGPPRSDHQAGYREPQEQAHAQPAQLPADRRSRDPDSDPAGLVHRYADAMRKTAPAAWAPISWCGHPAPHRHDLERRLGPRKVRAVFPERCASRQAGHGRDQSFDRFSPDHHRPRPGRVQLHERRFHLHGRAWLARSRRHPGRRALCQAEEAADRVDDHPVKPQLAARGDHRRRKTGARGGIPEDAAAGPGHRR